MSVSSETFSYIIVHLGVIILFNVQKARKLNNNSLFITWNIYRLRISNSNQLEVNKLLLFFWLFYSSFDAFALHRVCETLEIYIIR